MNEQQVKRYHKSFIGLMEQCNDGEWVRSEEFDKLKKQKETELEASRACSDSLITKWQTLYDKEVTFNTELAQKQLKAKSIISMYRCLSAFIIVSSIALLILEKVL